MRWYHLELGDKILDLGCGIGRDINYFKYNYDVEGLDGSSELVRIARANTDKKVYNIFYKDMTFKENYDGIWALAALVHLRETEIISTLIKISNSLKSGGVLYTSFKHGIFEGYMDGRYFTYLTEERFYNILDKVPDLEVKEVFYSKDRMGRNNTSWMNIICLKK